MPYCTQRDSLWKFLRAFGAQYSIFHKYLGGEKLFDKESDFKYIFIVLWIKTWQFDAFGAHYIMFNKCSFKTNCLHKNFFKMLRWHDRLISEKNLHRKFQNLARIWLSNDVIFLWKDRNLFVGKKSCWTPITKHHYVMHSDFIVKIFARLRRAVFYVS